MKDDTAQDLKKEAEQNRKKRVEKLRANKEALRNENTEIKKLKDIILELKKDNIKMQNIIKEGDLAANKKLISSNERLIKRNKLLENENIILIKTNKKLIKENKTLLNENIGLKVNKQMEEINNKSSKKESIKIEDTVFVRTGFEQKVKKALDSNVIKNDLILTNDILSLKDKIKDLNSSNHLLKEENEELKRLNSRYNKHIISLQENLTYLNTSKVVYNIEDKIKNLHKSSFVQQLITFRNISFISKNLLLAKQLDNKIKEIKSKLVYKPKVIDISCSLSIDIPYENVYIEPEAEYPEFMED